MVNSGVDSSKDVHPIRVDSSGRPYVLISDGTETLNIDSSNRAEVSALNVKPDGTNTLACMDARGRAGYQKITDGSNEAKITEENDNVTQGEYELSVINLNYVHDSANNKWVRQTPSSSHVFQWNALKNGFVTFAGTWATADATTRHLGRYLGNATSNDINDKIGLGSFYVPFEADYTLYMIGDEHSARSIAHFLVNGVDEGTIDWYAAATDYNALNSVSLGTLTVGLKLLSLLVGDNHPSSSDHIISFQSIVIDRT